MTETKLKSTFAKPYQVTVYETVGYIVNKHPFGFEGYEPRNQTLNLVPPKAF